MVKIYAKGGFVHTASVAPAGNKQPLHGIFPGGGVFAVIAGQSLTLGVRGFPDDQGIASVGVVRFNCSVHVTVGLQGKTVIAGKCCVDRGRKIHAGSCSSFLQGRGLCPGVRNLRGTTVCSHR